MGDYWVPGVKNTADALTSYGAVLSVIGFFVIMGGVYVVGNAFFLIGGCMQWWGAFKFFRYAKGKGDIGNMSDDEDFRKIGIAYIIMGGIILLTWLVITIFLLN